MSEIRFSPGNRQWFDAFVAEHGRAPRVLHIGNIANNAYNNARLMNTAGLDCDVICYDYYHVMGCPEWEDAAFEGVIDDISRPDWTKVDLHGFRRPLWFVQGPQALCLDFLLARRCASRTASRLWRQLAENNRTAAPPGWHRVGSKWRKAMRLLGLLVTDPLVIDKILCRLRRAIPSSRWLGVSAQAAVMAVLLATVGGLRLLAAPVMLLRRMARMLAVSGTPSAPALIETTAVIERLVDDFARTFPARTDRLQESDLLPYLGTLTRWQALFAHYDVIQGYSTDGIYPLLCGIPYAAFEHGTIRDIPFCADAQARICALTYRKAAATFITNSDTLGCADRLGIAADRRVYLPHPFDPSRLRDHAGKRPAPVNVPDGGVTFFAPSRHHWRDGAPSWLKGNDLVIRAAAALRRDGLQFRVVFVEWGQEVALSRALIDSLGCGDRIEWVTPMRKRELWDRYLDASCVIDQFVMPAIGGVAFEAMSLARRVITRIDAPTLEEFFGEAPPVMNAAAVLDVERAMRAVIHDPNDSARLGAAGSRWIDEFHSPERIVNLQVSAYRRLLQRGAASPLSVDRRTVPEPVSP